MYLLIKHRYKVYYTLVLTSFIFLLSCKKQNDISSATKNTGWIEIQKFSGLEKIILSSGGDSSALFFQQPQLYTTLHNQNIYSGINSCINDFPSDILIRIPITGKIAAFPLNDTIVSIVNNASFCNSPNLFNLKKIDNDMTKIKTDYRSVFKCMAINKNETVLLAYHNKRIDNVYSLFLLKLKFINTSPQTIDTLYTKKIIIPNSFNSVTINSLTAIDEYFLVDLGENGIYRISENGDWIKVFNSTQIVTGFYKWQNRIYGHFWDNLLIISTDKGYTWQTFSGLNSILSYSNFYTIKDSLIGIKQSDIYTLNWNGSKYVQRFLKNDGIETTKITGIEILRDSVYAATTNGLFVKSINSFFETK